MNDRIPGHPPVSPRTDRRRFVQLGSAGLAGWGLVGAPGLGTLQAANRRDTAVILFWLAGGPSHVDMYDLKPNAPAEVRGPFAPLDTNLPGWQVCELLPRHCRVANHLAVVQSIHHDLSVHDDASHWLQTGWPLLNARARGQQNPSQGSVVAALRGSLQPGVPAYVCIPEDYRRHMGFYETSAFLSSRFNAVNGGGDPSLGNYRPPDFSLPPSLTWDRLEDRTSLLRELDGWQRRVDAGARFRELDDVQREALELVGGAAARTAFDVSQEPEAVRDRYGRHAWGRAALLARRLVESGVTFVNINFYEKDVDWWDDHYTIEKNLRRRLPLYDEALAALIEDLHARGMAERVLVAAFGEFGRAPRIDSYAGRGHWPRAMTAILSGGGIRGGQVIGSTTKDGGEPQTRPLVPGDLLATMYHAVGINPEATVTDRQGRAIRLFDAGQPIRELI